MCTYLKSLFFLWAKETEAEVERNKDSTPTGSWCLYPISASARAKSWAPCAHCTRGSLYTWAWSPPVCVSLKESCVLPSHIFICINFLGTTIFAFRNLLFFDTGCYEHWKCLAIPYLIISFQFLSQPLSYSCNSTSKKMLRK